MKNDIHTRYEGSTCMVREAQNSNGPFMVYSYNFFLRTHLDSGGGGKVQYAFRGIPPEACIGAYNCALRQATRMKFQELEE